MSPPQRTIGFPFKLTVNLNLRQIALLDRLAVDLLLKRRFRITRSDLIAAIIDAWQSAGVDLSVACSGEEIAETMREVWGEKRKRRR
jgi:hypothetical protein